MRARVARRVAHVTLADVAAGVLFAALWWHLASVGRTAR